MENEYGVIAGRYWYSQENRERNCKYSHYFKTLNEAIAAYDAVRDYPWAFIEYNGRILIVKEKNFVVFDER